MSATSLCFSAMMAIFSCMLIMKALVQIRLRSATCVDFESVRMIDRSMSDSMMRLRAYNIAKDSRAMIEKEEGSRNLVSWFSCIIAYPLCLSLLEPSVKNRV